MIDLHSKEVFFTGENGQGKSNLLEAIYYSSYASSFRTHLETEMISRGKNEMSVRSLYREENGVSHSTFITFEKGEKNKKHIEKDGKVVHDRKDLINTMPCVLFNHDDLDFVIGEPERRRFFIDQSLSMYDVLYIDTMRRYRRVLKNRNLCLKEKNFSLVESYNIQLAQNGIEIIKKRKSAIFQFNQIFGKIYEEVSGIEGIKIKYSPSWKKQNCNSFTENAIPEIDEVLDFIKSKEEIEHLMGTTMSGPHRDRIGFIKENLPFVPTASTGQRRLLALALRSSQAVFYKQISGRNPILLMDDVLLELDPLKRQKFTFLLPEYDQLFCTFLPGEPWKNYKKENTKIYSIENGKWKVKE